MSDRAQHYYVPQPSHWMIFGSVGLFCMATGAASWFNGWEPGRYIVLAGFAILAFMMVRWFGDVVRESEGGKYGRWEDVSFRWGMSWFTFLCFQAYEYGHAYSDLNLKLSTGVYGSTFFMLTGFHGFHVTLGTIMLTVILARCLAGHFRPENHFAFEAVAWYWHFVDVVWLGLFVFVYWL